MGDPDERHLRESHGIPAGEARAEFWTVVIGTGTRWIYRVAIGSTIGTGPSLQCVRWSGCLTTGQPISWPVRWFLFWRFHWKVRIHRTGSAYDLRRATGFQLQEHRLCDFLRQAPGVSERPATRSTRLCCCVSLTITCSAQRFFQQRPPGGSEVPGSAGWRRLPDSPAFHHVTELQ